MSRQPASLVTPLLALGFLTAAVGRAQPSVPVLSLQQAQGIAAAVAKACPEREPAVAVVDASGQPLLMQRGRNTGPHNLEAARRKAYTSASTHQATLALSRQAAEQPDSRNLALVAELLLLGGGQPLWLGEQLLGAVGVAGAGGPVADDRCARAGQQWLASTLQP